MDFAPASPDGTGGVKDDATEEEPGAEEEPEEKDQWQYVETRLPELFDTETGAKLHYRKSCCGLEKANSVLNVRPCGCWLAADTVWPEAAEEIRKSRVTGMVGIESLAMRRVVVQSLPDYDVQSSRCA